MVASSLTGLFSTASKRSSSMRRHALRHRTSALAAMLAERFGSGVDLMKLKHGIFDEAAVSVISLAAKPPAPHR
jgi:hypothetical protein